MTQTLNVALCKVTPLSGSFYCWHNTCRQCQTTPPRTQTHAHTQSAVLIMTKSRLIWKGLLLCFRQTLTSLPPHPHPFNAYAHPLYCLQRMKTTLKVRMEAHFADAPSASSTNCSKYDTSHGCVGLFGHPINSPWFIFHVNCYVNSRLKHRSVNIKQNKQCYRPCEEISAACGLQLFDWSEEYLPWKCTEAVWWARGNWCCWMDRYHPGTGPCTQTWPWCIHARRVWIRKTADAPLQPPTGRQAGRLPPGVENRSSAVAKKSC